MGVDASVFVVVGFSTDNFKFFETELVDKKKCSQGHETENLKAAYCEYCGKKLSRISNFTPTPDFERFCKIWCKENDWEPDPDSIIEGLRDSYYNDEIGLWSDSDPGGRDHPEVFGVRIGDTGGLLQGGSGFSISEEKIAEAKAKVEKYRKIMKIEEPIKIHLMTSIG